jgi:hypothetical protein
LLHSQTVILRGLVGWVQYTHPLLNRNHTPKT